jgi:hypothetical protein
MQKPAIYFIRIRDCAARDRGADVPRRARAAGGALQPSFAAGLSRNNDPAELNSPAILVLLTPFLPPEPTTGGRKNGGRTASTGRAEEASGESSRASSGRLRLGSEPIGNVGTVRTA